MEGEERDERERERGAREEREPAERRRQTAKRDSRRAEKKGPAYPTTEIHDFKSRHTMETVNDVSEIERGITRARRREKIVRTGENDGVESKRAARSRHEETPGGHSR